MFQNVVIGNPVCEPHLMFAHNITDWEENEKQLTLFTTERFLPRIMVQCGLVSSVNEVRRNKPELMTELTNTDFIEVKWGKKRLYIQVE